MQAGAYYAVAMRSEITPAVAPLSTFPTASNGWQNGSGYRRSKKKCWTC